MAVKTEKRTERRNADDRGKIVTGIYRDDHGNELFVPTVKMLQARKLATSAKFQRNGRAAARRGDGPDVNAIEREISGGQLGTLRSYQRRFDDVGWFGAWLFKSASPPANVSVCGERDAKCARAVWNYGDILRSMGRAHPLHDYLGWFEGPARLPVALPKPSDDEHDNRRRLAEQITDFMLMLYGGRDPEGWLILPEWVAALRNELTAQAILRHLGMDRNTVAGWKKEPLTRRALLDAIDAARAGRDTPAGSEAWDHRFGKQAVPAVRSISKERAAEAKRLLDDGTSIHAVASVLNMSKRTVMSIRKERFKAAKLSPSTLQSADCILKFAKAARQSEAVKRVRTMLGTCGNVDDVRRRANELGCLESLDAYLYEGLRNIAAEFDVTKNGGWHRRGEIAPGIFLLSPLQREFRKKASAMWAEARIWTMIQKPGARFWFLDCTLPLPNRGLASVYRKAVGLLPSGGSPYRNDPFVLPTGGARAPINGGAPAGPVPVVPADAARLEAALAKCKSDGQVKIVQAVGRLTTGRADYWPSAKEIAKAAGCKNNSHFRGTVLPQLVERGALRKRDGKIGYRLA